MKKKMLILCSDFIPYTSSFGSSIRMVTLAQFLKKNDIDVAVISCKTDYYIETGHDDFLKQLEITYIDDALYRHSFVNDRNKFLNLFSFAFRTVANPDTAVVLIRKMYTHACSKIEKEGYNNILISSPKHGVLPVGYLLKKKYGSSINLIVDYRDSWTQSTIFRKRIPIYNNVNRIIEKRILSNCDLFTYVSDPIKKKLQREHHMDLKNSQLVMNGYVKDVDVNVKPASDNLKGVIRIGFFGALSNKRSSFRNIINLLEVIKKYPDLDRLIEFHFYGKIEIESDAVNKFKSINVHPPLRHDEAIMKMMEMDFLFLVHTDSSNSDEVVTGKFFDYVSVKRPIICMSPRDMEARRLIERYNLGIHIDVNDLTDIRDKLMNLKYLDTSGFYGDFDISVFKRDNQYKKILPYLIGSSGFSVGRRV